MENDKGERRVRESDPDFEELFRFANDLAIAKNPQRWFNLSAVREGPSGEGQKVMDASEVEVMDVVEEIEKQLEEAMVERGESFRAFVDFIEGLDIVERLDVGSLEPFLEFVEELDLDGFTAEEAAKYEQPI